MCFVRVDQCSRTRVILSISLLIATSFLAALFKHLANKDEEVRHIVLILAIARISLLGVHVITAMVINVLFGKYRLEGPPDNLFFSSLRAQDPTPFLISTEVFFLEIDQRSRGYIAEQSYDYLSA